MSDQPSQPRGSSPGAFLFGEADRRPWLAVAIVLLAFAVSGAWRAPVPGVNEPHYLGKARHFWEPAFCSRDLFIASYDAHWLLYATVGSLTTVLPFEQAAWLGRLLAWTALALGWVMLAREVAPGRRAPVWSAALFLAS